MDAKSIDKKFLLQNILDKIFDYDRNSYYTFIKDKRLLEYFFKLEDSFVEKNMYFFSTFINHLELYPSPAKEDKLLSNYLSSLFDIVRLEMSRDPNFIDNNDLVKGEELLKELDVNGNIISEEINVEEEIVEKVVEEANTSKGLLGLYDVVKNTKKDIFTEKINELKNSNIVENIKDSINKSIPLSKNNVENLSKDNKINNDTSNENHQGEKKSFIESNNNLNIDDVPDFFNDDDNIEETNETTELIPKINTLLSNNDDVDEINSKNKIDENDIINPLDDLIIEDNIDIKKDIKEDIKEDDIDIKEDDIDIKEDIKEDIKKDISSIVIEKINLDNEFINTPKVSIKNKDGNDVNVNNNYYNSLVHKRQVDDEIEKIFSNFDKKLDFDLDSIGFDTKTKATNELSSTIGFDTKIDKDDIINSVGFEDNIKEELNVIDSIGFKDNNDDDDDLINNILGFDLDNENPDEIILLNQNDDELNEGVYDDALDFLNEENHSFELNEHYNEEDNIDIEENNIDIEENNIDIEENNIDIEEDNIDIEEDNIDIEEDNIDIEEDTNDLVLDEDNIDIDIDIDIDIEEDIDKDKGLIEESMINEIKKGDINIYEDRILKLEESVLYLLDIIKGFEGSSKIVKHNVNDTTYYKVIDDSIEVYVDNEVRKILSNIFTMLDNKIEVISHKNIIRDLNGDVWYIGSKNGEKDLTKVKNFNDNPELFKEILNIYIGKL